MQLLRLVDTKKEVLRNLHSKVFHNLRISNHHFALKCPNVYDDFPLGLDQTSSTRTTASTASAVARTTADATVLAVPASTTNVTRGKQYSLLHQSY